MGIKRRPRTFFEQVPIASVPKAAVKRPGKRGNLIVELPSAKTDPYSPITRSLTRPK